MIGGLLTKADVDSMQIEGYVWNKETEKWDVVKEAVFKDCQLINTYADTYQRYAEIVHGDLNENC